MLPSKISFFLIMSAVVDATTSGDGESDDRFLKKGHGCPAFVCSFNYPPPHCKKICEKKDDDKVGASHEIMLDFNPNGRMLASGDGESDDRFLKKGHGCPAFVCSFNYPPPHCKKICEKKDDDKVGASHEIMLDFNPNGRMLASGDGESDDRFLKKGHGCPAFVCSFNYPPPHCKKICENKKKVGASHEIMLDFNPNGRMLASGDGESDDRFLKKGHGCPAFVCSFNYPPPHCKTICEKKDDDKVGASHEIMLDFNPNGRLI